MEKVRVTIPIKVKAKDGEKGEKGDKGDTGATGKVGITWRTSEWQSGFVYRNDEELSDEEIAENGNARYVDIVVVPNEGRTAVSKAYKCIQTHTSTDTTAPGTTGASGYWNEVSNLQGGLITPFILTSAAWIENLTVGGIKMYDTEGNTIFNVSKDDDGNVTIECNQGNFSNIVVNDGIFTGTLDGVTGTFKYLQCLDNDGNVQGKLSFYSSGDSGASFNIDFDTSTFYGDIYHQGTKNSRALRFYAQDIYCRARFGAEERTVLYVYGNGAYAYPSKNSGDPVKVSLSYTTYNSHAYYKIPCYGDSTSGFSGVPIDTIVFNLENGGTYYYDLQLTQSQRVLCVNGNDDENGVYIATHNGTTLQLQGGKSAMFGNYKRWLSPTSTITVGNGTIMATGYYDNNW